MTDSWCVLLSLERIASELAKPTCWCVPRPHFHIYCSAGTWVVCHVQETHFWFFIIFVFASIRFSIGVYFDVFYYDLSCILCILAQVAGLGDSGSSPNILHERTMGTGLYRKSKAMPGYRENRGRKTGCGGNARDRMSVGFGDRKCEKTSYKMLPNIVKMAAKWRNRTNKCLRTDNCIRKFEEWRRVEGREEFWKGSCRLLSLGLSNLNIK